MSANSPCRYLNLTRQTKFPNTPLWRWICPSCTTFNLPPDTIYQYGVCAGAGCQKIRGREAKVIWRHFAQIPRRHERTPDPIFKGTKEDIGEIERLMERGREEGEKEKGAGCREGGLEGGEGGGAKGKGKGKEVVPWSR